MRKDLRTGDATRHLDVTRHLQEAIARMHKEMRAVEIWAAALTGFNQPIPEYEPALRYLVRSGDDPMH
jgi:hypothetical protein